MLVKVTLFTVRNLRAAIYLVQCQIYSSPEKNEHCDLKAPVSKKNKCKGRDDGARVQLLKWHAPCQQFHIVIV